MIHVHIELWLLLSIHVLVTFFNLMRVVSLSLIVLNLILVVLFVVIIVKFFGLRVFLLLLRTWLEIDLLILILVWLELVILDIRHPLLSVSLLLLLSFCNALHPLEILLHLHILESEVERVDRGLLGSRWIWNWLRTLVVLQIHLVHLSLGGRLSLMRNLSCISAGIEEHNIVIVTSQLLLEAHL